MPFPMPFPTGFPAPFPPHASGSGGSSGRTVLVLDTVPLMARPDGVVLDTTDLPTGAP